jgi:hypothetical protein
LSNKLSIAHVSNVLSTVMLSFFLFCSKIKTNLDILYQAVLHRHGITFGVLGFSSCFGAMKRDRLLNVRIYLIIMRFIKAKKIYIYSFSSLYPFLLYSFLFLSLISPLPIYSPFPSIYFPFNGSRIVYSLCSCCTFFNSSGS